MCPEKTDNEHRPISLSEPHIHGKEWDYIKECLDGGWVAGGDFVDRFERDISTYLGAKSAVSTNSGTSALHIALKVAGVEADDEVLVSTLTFIAPANAIRYIGAWPIFIDAEPMHWQMSIDKMVHFIEEQCQWQHGELRNKTTKRRVKAILPVHILGHPVDSDTMGEMARKYDLVVVEDATESLGATYRDRKVGMLGDISCFSFNGNKVITAGGGGMIVTDNEEWGRRAKYLITQAKNDSMEYIHGEIGFNYRLSNLQAAVGCAQLEQIGEFIAAKRKIALNYAEALEEVVGLGFMREAQWASSICWLSTLLVDADLYGMDSRRLIDQLAQDGIQSRPLWQPLHLSPAHSGAQHVDCSVAEQIYEQAISLPCSVGLGQQQGRVVERLCELGQRKDEI